MKDFLGNELKVNDEVIYIKSMRTGSSTTRNVMFKGQVSGFTKKHVEVERTYTNEHFTIGNFDLIQPTHVCKLNLGGESK